MGDQPDEINEMGSGAEAQVPAAFIIKYINKKTKKINKYFF